MADSVVRVVQLTDFHLVREELQVEWQMVPGVAFREVLQAAAEAVPGPAALLLTGDFSNDDSDESYALGARLIRAAFGEACPKLFVPGNHDQNTRGLEAAFAGGGFTGTAGDHARCRAVDVGAWRLLLLNSMVPGARHGELSAETLAWLDGELAACDAAARPALLVLHHPLQPPAGDAPPWGVEHEGRGLPNLHAPERLAAVVAAHASARLLLHGHLHLDYTYRVAGATALCTPSTCHQIKPVAPTWEADMSLAPGFRVLELRGDGSFDTAVHRVHLSAAAYGAGQEWRAAAWGDAPSPEAGLKLNLQEQQQTAAQQ